MKYELKVICSCGEEHDLLIILPDMDSDRVHCPCGLVWLVRPIHEEETE